MGHLKMHTCATRIPFHMLSSSTMNVTNHQNMTCCRVPIADRNPVNKIKEKELFVHMEEKQGQQLGSF